MLFTSNEAAALAGITRRWLQTFGDTVPPARSGRRGPGRQDRYSFTQVLALAFARQVEGGGFFTRAAARAAAEWVARQDLADLEAAFRDGRSVWTVDEEDRVPTLVEPPVMAGRSLGLLLSTLDLSKCFGRLEKRRLARKGART